MTKLVELNRFAYTPIGTFGKLYMSEFECYTVERPWLNNKVRESCIPEGEYDIELGRFNRGGYAAYEVMNVPERSLIKIHIGNSMNDVIGCIAPGKSLGWIHQTWAVTSSTTTYKEFMKAMENAPQARLIISQWIPEEI